jgi:hypothetical protein
VVGHEQTAIGQHRHVGGVQRALLAEHQLHHAGRAAAPQRRRGAMPPPRVGVQRVADGRLVAHAPSVSERPCAGPGRMRLLQQRIDQQALVPGVVDARQLRQRRAPGRHAGADGGPLQTRGRERSAGCRRPHRQAVMAELLQRVEHAPAPSPQRPRAGVPARPPARPTQRAASMPSAAIARASSGRCEQAASSTSAAPGPASATTAAPRQARGRASAPPGSGCAPWAAGARVRQRSAAAGRRAVALPASSAMRWPIAGSSPRPGGSARPWRDRGTRW